VIWRNFDFNSTLILTLGLQTVIFRLWAFNFGFMYTLTSRLFLLKALQTVLVLTSIFSTDCINFCTWMAFEYLFVTIRFIIYVYPIHLIFKVDLNTSCFQLYLFPCIFFISFKTVTWLLQPILVAISLAASPYSSNIIASIFYSIVSLGFKIFKKNKYKF
jgi:hypothetical protein